MFSDYLSLLSSKAGCAIQVNKTCIDLQNDELLKKLLMSVLVHMKVPIYPPIPPSVFLCRVNSYLVLHELWVVTIDFHLFEVFTPAICVQKAICLHRLDLVLQVSNIPHQWCNVGVLCGICDLQKSQVYDVMEKEGQEDILNKQIIVNLIYLSIWVCKASNLPTWRLYLLSSSSHKANIESLSWQTFLKFCISLISNCSSAYHFK